MTSLRAPVSIQIPAHIRVISPASAALAYVPARALRGEQALTKRGFKVTYGRHADLVSDDGQTAGTAQQRAADVMEAFADPTVDAVLSAEAGYGTREILQFLDPDVLAANHKPFIGSCDNVYLNQYLAHHANISSLYGCTLMANLGEAGGPFPETVNYLIQALEGHGPLTCEPVSSRTGEFVNWLIPEKEASQRHRSIPGGWTWLNSGRATGPLRGGEITLIKELVTDFELTLTSAILFWHVAFHDHPPDQAFRELSQTADLTRIAGMVIGAHPAIPPPQWAAFVSDMLEEALPGLACPVVVNADIGNVDPSWTVPYGEQVMLDPDAGLIFRSQATERTLG